MEATDHREVTSGEDRSADIDRLNTELRREHEMYLRALADFDNYRRRVERERATADRAGKRDVILSVLEVLDSFEAALAHSQQAPSSVAAGMEAVYRKLLDQAGPDALVFFNLGVLLEDMGRNAEAAESYQAALQLDPLMADGHYNLALVCEQLGRAQEAIRHMAQYRKLSGRRS